MKYRTKTSPILIHQSAGARGGAAFGSSCLSASGRMILASVVAALALLVPLATPHSAVADNIIENGNFDVAINEGENGVRGGAVVLDPWLSVPSPRCETETCFRAYHTQGASTYDPTGDFGMPPSHNNGFPGVVDPIDGNNRFLGAWNGTTGHGFPIYHTIAQNVPEDTFVGGQRYEFSAQLHRAPLLSQEGYFCLYLSDLELWEEVECNNLCKPRLPLSLPMSQACCLEPTDADPSAWQSRSCTFEAPDDAADIKSIILRPLAVVAQNDLPYALIGIDEIVIQPFCGNGVLDQDEDCDDGNNIDGDCCSAVCELEDPLVVCDDDNFCTDEVCVVGEGCFNNANTLACDDDNACTTNDTCSAGDCAGGPLLECDDGLFCNGVETCDAVDGCQAGTAPAMDDGVACTDDSCDEVNDGIVNTVNDGNCDDDLFCTGVETCHAVDGCQAGTAPVIDDGVACTDDSCDELVDMVLHMTVDSICDDGLFCNGVETCDADDGCQDNAAPNADDGVACTDDSCDEVNDAIVNTVNDAFCDDGLYCTGVETCDAVLGCQDNADPDSDDGVACTVDTCDDTVAGFMVHTPDAALCDDGVACTVDLCDAQQGCLFEPDDQYCNDGDPCEVWECDPTNDCIGEEVLCDDGVVCTVDTCTADENNNPLCVFSLEPRQDCAEATRADLSISNPLARPKPTVKVTLLAAATTYTNDDMGIPPAEPSVEDDMFYSLCLWDYEDGEPVLWTELAIQPGESWRTFPRSSRVKFSARRGRHRHGVTSFKGYGEFRSGTVTTIKATGERVPLGPDFSEATIFAQDPYVQAQIVNSGGACWDGKFDINSVGRNSLAKFKAKVR